MEQGNSTHNNHTNRLFFGGSRHRIAKVREAFNVFMEQLERMDVPGAIEEHLDNNRLTSVSIKFTVRKDPRTPNLYTAKLSTYASENLGDRFFHGLEGQ